MPASASGGTNWRSIPDNGGGCTFDHKHVAAPAGIGYSQPPSASAREMEMLNWVWVVVSTALANLKDPEWLAGEIVSWLIFTVLVTTVLEYRQSRRALRDNGPYEGWSLRVIGYGPPDKDYVETPQKIYLDEVRRFEQSDFELWKFVKSVLSGTLITRLRTAEQAREVWLFKDETSKTITVDFEKIPDLHVVRWDSPKPIRRPAVVD